MLSCSVMSDSLCPMDCSPLGSSVHGDSLGKNTEVCCHALLQGIFPTQGSHPGLPHCRWILYHLSHQGSLTPHNTAIIFLISFLIRGKLLHNVVLVSAILQCELAIIIHIPPSSEASLPPPHCTPLGYHKVSGWAPCVLYQLPTSRLFYT